MLTGYKQMLHAPFVSEQACVAYLFAKRWPWGFCCPFCGAVQKEIAPAYAVVCRYCRKNTSITARTLMHGSKKSLVAWMLVAQRFCEQDQGLSARELQQLLELSCYQTAWRWLQKIRCGAALAESAPCRGVVLFDFAVSEILPTGAGENLVIAFALELWQHHTDENRVRMILLDRRYPAEIAAAVKCLVFRNSTLLMAAEHCLQFNSLEDLYLVVHPGQDHVERGKKLLADMESWLNNVYRGPIDTRYLQNYLDEYCFRHNTASWQNRQDVLEHLLQGLVVPAEKLVSGVQNVQSR